MALTDASVKKAAAELSCRAGRGICRNLLHAGGGQIVTSLLSSSFAHCELSTELWSAAEVTSVKKMGH